MKNNSAFFLLALFPVIPASSRFAYGIVLGFALLWLYLSSLVFRKIVEKIHLGDSGSGIELACLGGSATIYFLVLQTFFPVLSVSLDLTIFILTFSWLVFTSIDKLTLPKERFFLLLSYLAVFLIFSAFREIAGFGTLSFPVPSGLLVFQILPGFDSYGIRFWGTAGGTLILLGILFWIVKSMGRRSSSPGRNS